ncbi:MAG: tyrosine-type recombinase/integrase [Methanobrevibacter sp.]|nr:tyrosine-type recombinase/integrase [Methanosphaera sp.]MBR0371029.1 tyrosine-type recombinase/integrase [Methanobrevibacter sp.]
MILCKYCDKCEKLVYKRVLKSGREIRFIYCKGNRNIINLYKWNIDTYRKRPEIYTSCRIDGYQRQITYFFHRGKNEVISPVDGNLLNFSLDNLERLTKGQLMQKYTRGASKFPGVNVKNIKTKDGDYVKWKASLRKNGKLIYLGIFDDEYQAAHAYYQYCIKYEIPIRKDEIYNEYKEEFFKRDLNRKLSHRQKLRFEDETFKELMIRNKVENKNTENQYIYSLSKFTAFVGKPLKVILQEAKDDYDNKVFPDDGTVYKYLTTFQMSLIEEGLSGTTRSAILAKVKNFYKSFFIPVNPRIAREKEHRLKKSLEDIITIQDVEKLFYEADISFKPILLCLFSSGLRINDLLKLDCIDFVKSMKYFSDETEINKLLDDLYPKIYDDSLVAVVHNIAMKTKKSHYTFFNPQAVRWIVLYLLNRDDELTNNSPLFINKRNSRLRYVTVERQLIQIREKLGYTYAYNSRVNKIHFHGFRDAFATIMAPHMDYFRLENLMGHEHVLGHGNYVVQNPIEDLKLYQKLMHLLMFKESVL